LLPARSLELQFSVEGKNDDSVGEQVGELFLNIRFLVRRVEFVDEIQCMISGRTKAALAAAKARGVKLGGQRGSLDRMGRMAQKGNVVSAAVRRAASAKRNDD